MPAIRRTTSDVPPGSDREPPYYEATTNLYVSSPEAGAVPALAYRAGDRVVPDVIEANGWAGKVRVPDVFAGQLSPAPPAPEAPAPPAPEATAPASQSAGTAGTEE